MKKSRSDEISSFTIIKGSLIEETYTIFQNWDLDQTKKKNIQMAKESNLVGAPSQNWLRDIGKVINRRFDTDGHDIPLIKLAQSGCKMDIWRPLLLWHMTRDEFLLRDFLKKFLYKKYSEGAFRLHTNDVVTYLDTLSKRKTFKSIDNWSKLTISRVASSLLRMATDFHLLTGKKFKEFGSPLLQEKSIMYLLHAIAQNAPTPRHIVDSSDWNMYLLDSNDVEREILRMHQFQKLNYESAGSIVQLKLPYSDLISFAKELSHD